MSFIGDLLHPYPERAGNWPRERLLSGATAALLERAPALRAEFIKELTGLRPAGDVEVSVEHPVGDGQKRVDIQLAVEDGPLIWIETKFGAQLSGEDQLDRYDAALQLTEHRGDPRVLLYLPPVETGVHPKPNVPVWRWQDFGDLLKSYLQKPPADTAEHERWLVGDFVDYLKELDLMATDPVPANLSSIAQQFRSAHQALVRLQTQVDDRIRADQQWHPTTLRKDGGPPKEWPREYWSVYEPVPADRFRGCHFEWVMLSDEGATPVFAAGLIWRNSNESPSPLRDAAWVEKLRDLPSPDAFGRFQPVGHHVDSNRIYRELPLERLPETTLADQADVLAEFVRNSFSMLAEHAPT